MFSQELLKGVVFIFAAHCVLIILVGKFLQLLRVVKHAHQLRVVLVRNNPLVVWRAHIVHGPVHHFLQFINVLALVGPLEVVFGASQVATRLSLRIFGALR